MNQSFLWPIIGPSICHDGFLGDNQQLGEWFVKLATLALVIVIGIHHRDLEVFFDRLWIDCYQIAIDY